MNNIVPIKQGVFTENNLQYHKNIFERVGKQLNPHIFNHPKYKGLRLINENQLNWNNEYGNQKVRALDNPEHKKIKKSISDIGYDLNNPPICIIDTKQEKKPVIDGRTRGSVLCDDFKFNNIIAATFEPMSQIEFLEFGFQSNSPPFPNGPATRKDMEFVIKQIINQKKNNDDIKNDADLHNLINSCIFKLAPTIPNLSKSDKDSMTHSLRNEFQAKSAGKIKSFKNGGGVLTWLKNHGYKNTDKLVYIPVVTWHMKAIEKIITAVKEYPDVKKFRVVCHGSVLDSNNPTQDWKDRCQSFDIKFKNHLNNLAFISSNKTFELDPRIEIYGAIPMVPGIVPDETLYLFEKNNV
jgi:hypothetical protein